MNNNLKWRRSYQTIKFDTPDGDLDKDQFAVNPKGGTFVKNSGIEVNVPRWFIRNAPKNNSNFATTDDPKDIDGKTEVGIISFDGAFYDEFVLPDERVYRIPTTNQKYTEVSFVKDTPQPSKIVDDTEILEIIKDDSLWL